MTNHAPAEVWPMASFIADEMRHRMWTAVDLAKRMPGDYEKNIVLVNLVLAVQSDGMIIDRAVTEPISKAFGVSPEFFESLHETWLRWPDRRNDWSCPEHLLDGLLFANNDDH
jgi:hypothetical protein